MLVALNKSTVELGLKRDLAACSVGTTAAVKTVADTHADNDIEDNVCSPSDIIEGNSSSHLSYPEKRLR